MREGAERVPGAKEKGAQNNHVLMVHGSRPRATRVLLGTKNTRSNILRTIIVFAECSRTIWDDEILKPLSASPGRNSSVCLCCEVFALKRMIGSY